MEMNGAAGTNKNGDAAECAGLEVRMRKRFSARYPEMLGSFNLNVHFRVGAGITILFGPSGAGKTTVLDCIAGLTDPDEGHIVVGGKALFDSARKQSTPAWKRRVGYVLQDLALFPHLSAKENVAYGLRGLGASERRARCGAVMSSFRIADLGGRRPAEISGGERQRVALARALVTQPCVLLLDEPLAALDGPTKSRILDDLRQWNQEHRVPILCVTHSRDEVFALGEQIIILEAGHVVTQGRPHDVMNAPRIETIAQLSGFENIFDATVVALHEKGGSMTCRLGAGLVELETPLVRADVGARLRIGIRAGDLLLATEEPRGLSARNIVAGTIRRIEQRDVIVSTVVDCSGAEFEVHLTMTARESLGLAPGKKIWVVVKTHSCHLMRE